MRHFKPISYQGATIRFCSWLAFWLCLGLSIQVNGTGAVSEVGGDVLITRPVTNATSMPPGRMPGVRVVQNSGQPGDEGLSIRISGQGTFSGAGSNPLVLIDGVEGSLGRIASHITCHNSALIS